MSLSTQSASTVSVEGHSSWRARANALRLYMCCHYSHPRNTRVNAATRRSAPLSAPEATGLCVNCRRQLMFFVGRKKNAPYSDFPKPRENEPATSQIRLTCLTHVHRCRQLTLLGRVLPLSHRGTKGVAVVTRLLLDSDRSSASARPSRPRSTEAFRSAFAWVAAFSAAFLRKPSGVSQPATGARCRRPQSSSLTLSTTLIRERAAVLASKRLPARFALTPGAPRTIGEGRTQQVK